MGLFRCNLCSYTTGRRSDLKRHLKSHTGEKPFGCDQCDYRASMKADLTKHMRIHSGEKRYSCEVCDYRATDRWKVAAHMKTHTGEKPFGCELCDYRANRRWHVTAHMKIHTGEKRYACEFCNYRAGQPGDLKRHMNSHTGDRPYTCVICNYSSSRASVLNRHNRTHQGQAETHSRLGAGAVSSVKASSDELDGSGRVGEELLLSKLCQVSSDEREVSPKVATPDRVPSVGGRDQLKEGDSSSCEDDGVFVECEVDLLVEEEPEDGSTRFAGDGQAKGDTKLFGCSQCSYTTGKRRDLKRHLIDHIGKSGHEDWKPVEDGVTLVKQQTLDLGRLK